MATRSSPAQQENSRPVSFLFAIRPLMGRFRRRPLNRDDSGDGKCQKDTSKGQPLRKRSVLNPLRNDFGQHDPQNLIDNTSHFDSSFGKRRDGGFGHCNNRKEQEGIHNDLSAPHFQRFGYQRDKARPSFSPLHPSAPSRESELTNSARLSYRTSRSWSYRRVRVKDKTDEYGLSWSS